MPRLSAELERFICDEARSQQVTLADILNLSGERTFGFLFAVLSLPSALPIPAPGYSIPFGIVLFVLAVQLMLGRQRPWLPGRWQRRGFELQQVRRVVKAGVPWLRRIEQAARPRLTPVCTHYGGRLVLGLAIALMAISMMIPIPGTNTLPALGIFVTGIGLLEDDGALSIAGLMLCVVAGSLSSVILFAGVKGTSAAIQFLLDLISRAQPAQ